MLVLDFTQNPIEKEDTNVRKVFSNALNMA